MTRSTTLPHANFPNPGAAKNPWFSGSRHHPPQFRAIITAGCAIILRHTVLNPSREPGIQSDQPDSLNTACHSGSPLPRGNVA